jgi:hypothetical protein
MTLAVLEVVHVFQQDVHWGCRELWYHVAQVQQGARPRVLCITLFAHGRVRLTGGRHEPCVSAKRVQQCRVEVLDRFGPRFVAEIVGVHPVAYFAYFKGGSNTHGAQASTITLEFCPRLGCIPHTTYTREKL